MPRQQDFHEKYIEEPNTGCWLWLAYTNEDGYGVVRFEGRPRKAHRVSYEAAKGSIPPGLVIDHLCRQRCCVNPDHMEPVTRRVNALRGVTIPAAHLAKSNCPRGHALENASWPSRPGRRWCPTCHEIRNAEKRAERAHA